MQSTWDGKVVSLRLRESDMETAAPPPTQRNTALPRRLVEDAWWLVPRVQRNRPRLALVLGCGARKP